MPISPPSSQTTTLQRNEAPTSAAKASTTTTTTSTNEMVVAYKRATDELANVKLSEAETVELKNKRWQLEAGIHNGMERWQLNEIGAKIADIDRQLAEGS